MKLDIVVPCYNESEAIEATLVILEKFMKEVITKYNLSEDSKVIYVDDGSSDDTWQKISQATETLHARGIKLSKNKGHQNALLAGIAGSDADIVISIDADLQDDITAMYEMIEYAQKGIDIVYGVRKARDSDSFFKKHTAQLFYKLMGLFGVKLVFNHADFRCMSRKAVNALLDYQEVNIFIRGIVSDLGFSSAYVYYDRKARQAGETKYPLRKMLSFAWQGITSFSIIPLRLISFAGILLLITVSLVSVYVIYLALWTDYAVQGWASTILAICFLGSIQLISIGVLGEYIGKIYFEAKQRPKYFVEQDTAKIDEKNN